VGASFALTSEAGRGTEIRASSPSASRRPATRAGTRSR